MLIEHFYKKKIAFLFLTITIVNTLLPCVSYALTSGPSQPETKGFQAAGTSDMVDLFTGDFKYNVPLLDVDGYPVNLNYQSGVGMDDEASWVGLGWSLNIGAINRQLRGLPDDFSGDLVTTEHYTKPKVTIGGRVTAKSEFKGGPLGVTGSLSLGVFNDNYTRIGGEFGANVGISASQGGHMTAGLGLGVMSNTADGVRMDISPFANLSVKDFSNGNLTTTAGISAGFGYNTRSGMKSRTLGSSFNVSGRESVKKESEQAAPTSAAAQQQQQPDPNATPATDKLKYISGGAGYSLGTSSVSYNTEPISPRVSIPYKSSYGSFSFDIGGVAWALFAGVGGTGYKSVREVKDLTTRSPAYGFLYAEKGKDNSKAMMDFIREKDNLVTPSLSHIAMPVHLPDLFSFTSQTGGGQFRLYRGGSGAFFDNEAVDVYDNTTLGLDLGGGAYFHGGITEFRQGITTATRKWKSENAYLSQGDFKGNDNPGAEQVYFKMVGEKSMADTVLFDKLYRDNALQVNTSGKTASASFTGGRSVLDLKKAQRELKRTVISYRTAGEAFGVLDSIKSYQLNQFGAFQIPPKHRPLTDLVFARVNGIERQRQHISEVTITDEGGKRMVYGIPVYNLKKDEYSFAKGQQSTSQDGLVDLPASVNTVSGSNLVFNPAGISSSDNDNYYHKESQPGYATSYLLTGVLSPDYVDKTGNGISDDDLGTAVKFNYSKLHDNYRWRTPYTGATANKCLMADANDDKGSIVYGEKELWYLHSIETKTKIAYFIVDDREDGLGVLGPQGGKDPTQKQKRLREIRLYSKADLSKPIKIVRLDYDYSLCPGTLNSSSGKLTLTRLHFLYGNSLKGKANYYEFNYNRQVNGSEVHYANQSADRWGIYKPDLPNAPFNLNNAEFPYTNQNLDNSSNTATANANQYAALWQLSEVKLPTGGRIEVAYESDDYAYVQNKRAMMMTKVDALINTENQVIDPGQPNYLTAASGFKLRLPAVTGDNSNATTWFKNAYLNGSNYIYAKFCVNFATGNSNPNGQPFEMVSTYGEVSHVSIIDGFAYVLLKSVTENGVAANPISHMAWQRIKEEYPRYAYPGFDRRVGDNDGSGVERAVRAILTAVKNLDELKEGFYQKAKRKNYASQVDLQRSMVRIVQPNGKKLGGGLRVSDIRLSDEWGAMTETSNPVPGRYGQHYTYTVQENGKEISSGVASFEPSTGGDENPLRLPVPATDEKRTGASSLYNVEEPFGESFFPGASVGYRYVKVTDLDRTGNSGTDLKTGYTVSEFYTAREFPVRVKVLPLTKYDYQSSGKYSFFEAVAVSQRIYSQGYALELNDMHGKPKAERAFNQSGSEIASTVYQYNAKPSGGLNGEMQLVNRVNVLTPDGKFRSRVIGRDIDFFTDFREQETVNEGKSVNIGLDVIPAFFIPLPIPHIPKYRNSDYKLFRSACAVKVLQYYGVVDKVIKTVDGASTTTENLAYDAVTGDALVTKTKNEFDRGIYSINLPAYWAYPSMGGAFQNIGTIFTDFSTPKDGSIQGTYGYYLQPGDELIDINDNSLRYWIINDTYGIHRLVDRRGNLQKVNSVSLKVLRSGYRNQLDASVSAIVCLENPLDNLNARLKLVENADLTRLKVINASANTFDDSWAAVPDCPEPYIENPEDNCFMFQAGSTSGSYGTSGTRIFGVPTTFRSSSNYTVIPQPAEQKLQKVVDSTSTSNAVLRTSASSDCPVLSSLDNVDCTRKNFDCCLRAGVTNPTKPIDRCGIWLASNTAYNINDAIGFDSVLVVPYTKDYYIGYAADNELTIDVDNEQFINETTNSTQDLYRYWTVRKIRLTEGIHKLRVTFKNGCGPGNNYANLAVAGVEIYNNTYQEIANAPQQANLNLLFTTRGLRGKADVQVFRNGRAGGTSFHYINLDGTPHDFFDAYYEKVNPYIAGFLGNWRHFASKVLQQTRHYAQPVGTGKRGLNVREAGYLNSYFNYWFYNGSNWATDSQNGRSRWVTANRVTLYDRYGQELENQDALKRYSAASFDFNGELPAAVASNAMNRELYSNTFEDASLRASQRVIYAGCGRDDHEFTSSGMYIDNFVQAQKAHTGFYSALMPSSGFVLRTTVHTEQHKTRPYLARTEWGNYRINPGTTGLIPQGFEPKPSKYIFNAWVKDDEPYRKIAKVGMFAGQSSVLLRCKAVVEGWKLLEGEIYFNGNSGDIELQIYPNSSGFFIDDIRIFPAEAHMKTYTYDRRNMRLMAELDENAFATLYEYDDEGNLIRVKKETEKGIMTLKESHSSFHKKPVTE